MAAEFERGFFKAFFPYYLGTLQQVLSSNKLGNLLD